MCRKRYKPEQIISLLREAEVGLSQGRKVVEVCRSLGISEQSSETNYSTVKSSTHSRRQRYSSSNGGSTNTVRPHSSLGYRLPAPLAILPDPVIPAYAMFRPAKTSDRFSHRRWTTHWSHLTECSEKSPAQITCGGIGDRCVFLMGR